MPCPPNIFLYDKRAENVSQVDRECVQHRRTQLLQSSNNTTRTYSCDFYLRVTCDERSNYCLVGVSAPCLFAQKLDKLSIRNQCSLAWILTSGELWLWPLISEAVFVFFPITKLPITWKLLVRSLCNFTCLCVLIGFIVDKSGCIWPWP